MSQTPTPSRGPKFPMRLIRALLFGLVIGLIHYAHAARTAREALTPATPVSLADVVDLFPAAGSRAAEADERGLRQVLDSGGTILGSFLRTSPFADTVIGFCGPTDTLLAFDAEQRVLGTKILTSDDTRDHVAAIRSDPDFLSHLRGLSWAEASANEEIDGVSGATLTSVAIQEGLLLRLGGGKTSLRFSEPIGLTDVHALFPDAVSIEPFEDNTTRWRVLDDQGVDLGSMLRTSPAGDAIVGYQGPTDTLVGFDRGGRLTGLQLLQTYDNEEYAIYLREDDYFPRQFTGLMLAELGALDWRAAGIDGVSGSTLISNSVTEAMILAAQRANAPPEPLLDWRLSDFGTAIIVLLGAVIGLSSLRANSKLRMAFLCVLIVYLGIMNGDMLSQAQLVGWAQHGVPWRTAGGLLMLTLAAFLIPLTTRRNLYCSHLCPHGALQQLVKKRLPWQTVIPGRLARALRLLPFALLAVCVVVPITGASFSLVDLEPFDAWVYSVAGWPTLAIAVVGLAASLFVPMAYCRYGCPTGALLRFMASSGRWSMRDTAATSLVMLAAVSLLCSEL